MSEQSFSLEPPAVEGTTKLNDIFADLADDSFVVGNKEKHRELYIDLVLYTLTVESEGSPPNDFPLPMVGGYALGVTDAFTMVYGAEQLNEWLKAAEVTAALEDQEPAKEHVEYPQMMVIAETLVQQLEEQTRSE